MNTKFSDLHPFVRALLGDNDPQKLQYSVTVLNTHLRLRILSTGDSSVQETGNSAVFTEELSAAKKAKLIYESVRSLIVNTPDMFAYKTPVLSVTRRGMVSQLLAYIDNELFKLEGDGGIRYDTELNVLLNGAWNFYQNLGEAWSFPNP